MALKPLTYEEPLFQLLREENVKEFNRRKAAGETVQFQDCDFRHLDLRGLDAAGIDFSNSYFRAADLRGIDFSTANLSGVSLNNSRISGALFAIELAPEEIELSVNRGTRLRYRK
ncbi:MAG: hypothetical protein EXR70_05125 [Deltaproteobacteria bacterium]|nr:hypothetical protein [Deltaproteobacteria bacterium]